MPMSRGALLEMIRELFSDGSVVIITGSMGSGKSTAALYFAVLLMQNFKNYYVMSNIVIKRRLPDEDGSRRWERASYPHYVPIRSYAELFYNMQEIRTANPRARFLWIFDEIILAGVSSRHSVFSIQQRQLVMFLTLLRKMGLSVIFVALAGSLLPKHLRSVGGAFVSGLVSKEKGDIMRKARHLLSRFDERSIMLLTMPQYSDKFEILTMENIRDMPLVKPEQYAQVGDIVFDTLSPASFEPGMCGPGSRKPFVLEKFLSYISGALSHELPGMMKTFFEKEGDVEVDFDEFGLTLEEALKPATKGTERWRKEVALPIMRDGLPDIIKKWPKRKSPSKAWISRELQALMKEHGHELSLSSIKTSYWPTLLAEEESIALLKRFQ